MSGYYAVGPGASTWMYQVELNLHGASVSLYCAVYTAALSGQQQRDRGLGARGYGDSTGRLGDIHFSFPSVVGK